jgi:hypothetical protein
MYFLRTNVLTACSLANIKLFYQSYSACYSLVLRSCFPKCSEANVQLVIFVRPMLTFIYGE